MTDKILILDFGSQYTQLIARRVREAHVYSEIKPWSAPEIDLVDSETRGLILSGGPLSIYAPDAPQLPEAVLSSRLPILGICYGMQALTYQLGGKVAPSQQREYGLATVKVQVPNPLLPEGDLTVWMSHGDRIISNRLAGRCWPVLLTARLPPSVTLSITVMVCSFIRRFAIPSRAS